MLCIETLYSTERRRSRLTYGKTLHHSLSKLDVVRSTLAEDVFSVLCSSPDVS